MVNSFDVNSEPLHSTTMNHILLYASPHPTPSYTSPTPHVHTPLHLPSLYCTLQGTVDSMVLSDGGKGENSDPESEAVVTSTDVMN